ncbi:hypothetical protein OG884_10750 [Streptosporangium sp. NBC_01755]|uniref:hypothetical protein n=1 Tax=unclassified Streptosporangium TaxID=2632669 RepID=UPI002DD84386|nr:MULTISPECIES: hypothetical protein [unclassified Streptosporangium]WSA26214.1 hypothetical protein OIE13_35935 [Streptosporangium sp. NBC_01810]WSD02358.1 hypothetical protein OG884_10750 [Streptosporangium sp. NBC_01755]
MSASSIEADAESLRHEPGEDLRALRTLTLRFPGWCPWYGKTTGHWWALSPTRYRQHIGLVEADTPAELAARMRHIEDFHPHPEQHDQPPHPLADTDHRTAVRDIRGAGGSQSTEITSKGGDRDGRATAVRTRRRAR